jgi:polar amino acid transport system substrate-binding protein
LKSGTGIFFAAGIFLVAAGGICAGCSKHRQQRGITIKEGILSVGVEIGYPPMEYYDTDGVTPAGFDIQLAGALAGKMGLTVNYIDTAWEGILAGVQAGRYDIAINITITPERQMAHNFTDPYIENCMVIAALKDSSAKIENPEDIAGHSAAYQENTTAQYFAERLKDRGIHFTSFPYDKIMNCFDDLMLGRVDAVVTDSLAASYYTEKENSPFRICWQGPVDETIGICLKKGNDALTGALNKALDELFADGTMLNISRAVFGRDVVSSVRRQKTE